MISQFRSNFDYRDRLVKLLDVAGRPVDWNCMYDGIAKPLNIRGTLMNLDGQAYTQPPFQYLVSDGLVSLRDIPDQGSNLLLKPLA